MRRGLLWLVLLGTACTDADGDGYAAGVDCDDADASVSPIAIEVCDGVDNDCNGQIDEDVSIVAWQDRDGDGYGDPERKRRVCEMPEDGVDNGDDCDDLFADASPEGVEVCDGRDNDCDGTVDEEGSRTYFKDADGDGHGVPGDTIESCVLPEGYSRVDDDCDDGAPAAWTDNPEVCDGFDNDCDEAVDEGLPERLYYADADGDGYGDPDVAAPGCGPTPGRVDNALDCDDDDADLNPDTPEVEGNGRDDDCDGFTDEIAVPTHQPTLEAALAAADPGDVVQLGAGLWVATVDLRGRDVTLAGEGCDRTVLYGDGAGTTIRMDDQTVSDLKVAGGSLGGIEVVGGEAVVRRVCVEGNAHPGFGGGIDLAGGRLTLEDSLVVGNLAALDGGGIHVDLGAELVARRVRVLDNYASFDGGGLAVRGGQATFLSSAFAGNRAYDDGGAVILRPHGTPLVEGHADFRNVSFVANEVIYDPTHPGASSSFGSALFAMPDTSADLVNCLFAYQDLPGEQPNFDDFDAVVTASFTGYIGNGEPDTRTTYEVAARRGDADFVYFEPGTDPLSWDLRLQPGSSYLDAGDPGVLDPDGSRSDLGAYGGPDAPADFDDGYRLDDDGDGLLDPWEARWGLATWRDDAEEDPDADGLDNAGEFSAGTSPFDPDSDDDGTPDGVEVQEGTDPTSPADHWPFAVLRGRTATVPSEALSIDGSLSFDPDGDTLTYAWSLDAGPTSATLVGNGGVATLTPAVAGRHVVALVVSDGVRTARATHVVDVFDATIVPDDVAVLQDALDDANDDGVIAVRPGTWPVELTSNNRDLWVIGLGEADEVILHGEGTHRVVSWTDHQTLDLRHVTLADGRADDGGNLACTGCPAGDTSFECTTEVDPRPDLRLIDVIVRDGFATRDGGGLLLELCGVEATDLVVATNTAGGTGGGLYVDTTDLTARGAVVRDNSASGLGGGMYVNVRSQRVEFTNSVLQGNDATDGAALYWNGSSSIVFAGAFDQCVFADHTASLDVIAIERGRVRFFNDVFVDNAGRYLLGGGDNVYTLYPLFWPADGPGGPVTRIWQTPSAAPPEQFALRPPVVRRTDDGDSTNDLWALAPGAVLLDRGHPDRRDPDGTRADVGLGGGAGAPGLLRLDAVDADADGMSDGWEARYGLARGVDDGSGDLDGDGRTNLAEYLAGTRPDLAD